MEPLVVSASRDWTGKVDGYSVGGVDSAGINPVLVVLPRDEEPAVLWDIVPNRSPIRAMDVPACGQVFCFAGHLASAPASLIELTDRPVRGSTACAPSTPSDARYHLRYRSNGVSVLAQELLPPGTGERGGRTSAHYHTGWREYWRVLGGSGELRKRSVHGPDTRYQVVPLTTGDVVWVEPFEAHMLVSEHGLWTCIVQIVLPGVVSGRMGRDHHYVDTAFLGI